MPFRFIVNLVIMKRRTQSTHCVIKVGITGGIGSGKTTVCKMFEQLGTPVYYADDRAKYLMQHEHHLIDEITKRFGADVYTNGILNRKVLAEKVFNDKAKLELLNSLVHPAVYHDTDVWMEQQKLKKAPYTLKEAALLIETGSYKALDKLIVVTAPLETRVQRVSQRDQLEIEDVMARVRNQLPEAEKIKLADFIIRNDKDLTHLKTQVLKIHEQLSGETK